MDSFQAFLFFIAIVFFSFKPSRSMDSCVTQCGSQRIRFPFSLIGQPQQCGYNGFNLSCQFKDLHILTIPYLGNFSVSHIDYTKQVVQMRYSQACLPSILLQGLHLSGGPFMPAFTQTYTFYKCPTDATLALYAGVLRIPCLSEFSFDVVAVPTDVDIPSTSVCAEIATVSVPRSVTGWLDNIITLGWTEPDCRGCESHKGTCLPGNVTAGLQVGCHRKKGISGSVRYGLLFGLGIPLVCILAVLSCVKISLSERQTYLVSDILMTSAATNGVGRPTPAATALPNPNGNGNVCCICLCQYEATEMLKAIPNCNHFFHVHCIDQWLQLNATCPICRDKFEEPASLAL
ncbi:hypothetical protein V6N13_057257 [Hibiscus sabdariffa]|uniref:RING-type E3 ubiquitin transferase n=2 Tax=Hibiscus sabdariffa TaxID=183260 RepID=A0ABR2ADL2_9ROSI